MGLRAEADLRNEKINYKVREHSLAKVPVLLVVGKKEAAERKVSIQQVIQRLRGKITRLPAVNVYLTPIQNINVGGRSAKSLYQLTLQAVDLEELERVAPELEKRIRDAVLARSEGANFTVSSAESA